MACEVRAERETLSVSLDGMVVSVADRANALSGFVAFEATGPGGLELRGVRIASADPVADGTRGLPAADAPGITKPEGHALGAWPAYTRAALASEGDGTVMLEFVIEADGRLGDLRVVVTPHPDLADRRRRLRCAWRFTPATEGRRPRRRRRDDGPGLQAQGIADRSRPLHSAVRAATRHRVPKRFLVPGHLPAVRRPERAAASPPAPPPAGASPPSIPPAALERVPDEARDRTLHLRRLRRSDGAVRPAPAAVSGETLSRCRSPSPSVQTFSATVVRDGPSCYVLLPFDPKAVFGTVRAPVVVTIARLHVPQPGRGDGRPDLRRRCGRATARPPASKAVRR